VSDHEYEVEHNKGNRPEIPRGGGGKKKEKRSCAENCYGPEFKHLLVYENFEHISTALCHLSF